MLLTAGFAACSALYFLVDNVFDGFFIDWFEGFFTQTEGHFNPAEGTGEIWHTINWGRLKPFVLAVFIGGTLLWLTAAFVAAQAAAKRQEKRTITDISERLRAYMKRCSPRSRPRYPRSFQTSSQPCWKMSAG